MNHENLLCDLWKRNSQFQRNATCNFRSLLVKCLWGLWHSSFVPKLKKVEDNEFSSEYVNIQQHNEGLLKHFFSRKYFIDNSRLLLLNHFIFIDDGMNVLELGPGFPGLFHQLKLTGKQLNLYSVEPNPETNRLLEDYGVKSIGLSFPLTCSSNSNSDNINSRQTNDYSQYFNLL